MNDFLSWLTLSGLGILFGFFPGYATARGVVYESILVGKRKPVRWMYLVFFIDRENPEIGLGSYGPRRGLKVTWYISIGYVAIFLIVAHYFSWVGVNREVDILTIIIEETSLPMFLLLTWLLPAYFMKNYLKKLKPGKEVDRYSYFDYE